MRHTRTTRRLSALVAACLFALALATVAPAGPAVAADSGSLLTWNRLTTANAPPARLHAAVALDVATGTVVLFGGRAGNQLLNDTWTWDGSAWTAQSPPTSPPPLESASMAYDNIGHHIILFGGVGSDGNATNATWSWDGAAWTALAPVTSPPPRYQASLAADAVTNSDLLFGGLSAPVTPLGDTWSWDGNNWTLLGPVAAPPARSAAAMTFDPARGVVVLFGGMSSAETRDTWSWDGKNWTQLTPLVSPPVRSDAAMAFDTATQSAVLFGGSSGGNVLGDTWLWNGTNWSTSLPLSLVPNLNPPARSGASAASGPAGHRPVLFGGDTGGADAAPLGDTWGVTTLAVTPPSTTPTTTPGSAAASSTTTVPGPATSSTTTPRPPSTPPTSTPTTRAAAPRAPLAVTASSVHRGQEVTVSGSGFVPYATITITFHSARVLVGMTTADAQGRFSAKVQVPADLPAGTHNIEAAGAARAGGRTVLVAQVSVTIPGSHHGWLLPAFMIAFTVLLAVGAGGVFMASARWHPNGHSRS